MGVGLCLSRIVSSIQSDLDIMHIFLLDEPEVTFTAADLAKIGVLSWQIPVDTLEKDGILEGICRDRKYTYKDVVRALLFTSRDFSSPVVD